jgi:hypothetical protein
MIIVTIIYLLLGSVLLIVSSRLSVRSADAEAKAIERIAAFVATCSGDISSLKNGVAYHHFVLCVVYVADRVNEQAYEPLRAIVRYYNIENELISRAWRSKNSGRRAYLLALLARLPLSMATVIKVEKFLTDKSADVRFYALMSIFSVAPYRAVAILESMEQRLSRREVAEILTLLGRGYCPIPYTKLIVSENYNLQLLGLHLVRRFGITESRAEIALIVRDLHNELRDDALETLAYFGERERFGKFTVI